MKLVSVLFQAIGRISQTNKNTLSEAWNKSEKHRTRQKAKIFGCLSYSIPISQTGISQKGNFGVSGLFQGQKVSGLFCTLRGKWVSGLFYGRISGLFCGLVWLSIVTLGFLLYFITHALANKKWHKMIPFVKVYACLPYNLCLLMNIESKNLEKSSCRVLITTIKQFL